MAINQFIPFAAQPGANVVSQSQYAADPTTGMGFSSGIALSAKLNKVWRQSSFVSAGVAELMTRLLNKDTLDDGNLENFVQQLEMALISMRPKQVLTSPLTNFYVSATRGSDFNDGMTSLTPWQTLQYAVDTVSQNFDFNQNEVVINVEDGNYTPFVVGTIPQGSFGKGVLQLTVRGNIANPAACRIISQTDSCISATGGASVYVEGFHLESRGSGLWEGNGIIASGGGRVDFQTIDFGVCSMAHCFAVTDGLIAATGNYIISGGAANHMRLSGCGEGGRGATPIVVSIVGSVNFSTAFILLDGLSYYFWDGNNVQFAGSGNVTGVKHKVFSNSVLQVVGGSINYFPGTLAGSVPAQANTPDPGGSNGLFMTDFPGNALSALNAVDIKSFR